MLKSKLGRGYRARATRVHFARLPTEVPIPLERRNVVPDMAEDGLRWYVCTTAPQQERRAAESLRRERERLADCDLPPFVAYVPCDTFWQARKRGALNLPRREIQRPTLRSYCFIAVKHGLDPLHLNIMSERNLEGHNRHGLLAILGNRDGRMLNLGPSDVKFLARLAKAEIAAGKTDEVSEAPTFEVDDAVSVTDGAFAGHAGEVRGVDIQQRRLLIELQIFGRATPIELDFGHVAKAA